MAGTPSAELAGINKTLGELVKVISNLNKTCIAVQETLAKHNQLTQEQNKEHPDGG